MEKVVIKNFAKLTGKHLCQSLVFNKVEGWRPVTLVEKRCFSANFAKFSRAPNSSGRLLLYVSLNLVPLMPGDNKKVTRKVCLSMCYLFVTTRH